MGPVGRIPGPTRGARAWSVVLLLSRGEVGPAAWWVPVGPTQRHIWPASSRLARLRGHGRRGRGCAPRAQTDGRPRAARRDSFRFSYPLYSIKAVWCFGKISLEASDPTTTDFDSGGSIIVRTYAGGDRPQEFVCVMARSKIISGTNVFDSFETIKLGVDRITHAQNRTMGINNDQIYYSL